MSLTDRVIRNTYYFSLSQFLNFIFGFILTPLIIAHLGNTGFAVYALVLGFAGIFGLFDMSLSTSFIKFISEHYYKKEYSDLNNVINTGFLFYLLFSSVCFITGLIFMEDILNMLNIDGQYMETARLAFMISLAAFFITNTFGIFNSVLISLQKMYITSISGIILSVLNFTAVIIILSLGYGLMELLWLHIVVVGISVAISIYYAFNILPELKLNPFKFHPAAFKKMIKFGVQMQISKLSSFASEKYEEYLLAVFSVIGNVTYYNISAKVVRAGRFLPYLLVPQVAPVAAEINARNDSEKLTRLFEDTTKYLVIISVPVFVYLFIFANLIIESWVGKGYEFSAQIMRILVLGQLINMTFSAPGNSIIPNLGKPKYQMLEGLIFLFLNLIVSYYLIKNYGLTGAASGNAISTIVASLFVFHVSSVFFRRSRLNLLNSVYKLPLIAVLISGLISAGFYLAVEYFTELNRLTGLVVIAFTLLIFTLIYSVILLNVNYLNKNDKLVLLKVINKILPLDQLVRLRHRGNENIADAKYNNELVSIFIVTCNRLEFLKKNLSSLLPTLKNINYDLIIWNNASTDGTREYLNSLKIPGIRVIHSENNIGTNAKARAAELCKGDYIVGIDDDVLQFPEDWLEHMIRAYKSVPRMGYLAADVVQNQYTTGAKPDEQLYFNQKYGEYTIQFGPAGGWCFIISKQVFGKIGNFTTAKNRIFFSEDGDYLNRLKRNGYRYGILKGVKVFHATGEYYNKDYKELFKQKMLDYTENKTNKNNLLLKIKNVIDMKGLYYMFLDYLERNLHLIK
jgi:O-antigen/teichoic acid export membrane protein/GT2 family glycosyltransferase